MSGPIVRKYGFPNFEKIFGKRELEHGVDEADQRDEASEPGNVEESTVTSAADQTAAKLKERAPKP
jgi:hypothetical protein